MVKIDAHDIQLSEQLFYLTEPEAESMVAPGGMTDVFRRKVMALLAGFEFFIRLSLLSQSYLDSAI